MQRMEEWEQIKKEYKEVEIPQNGSHQMLEAMARAKREKKRRVSFACYGSVAAAVFLFLLLPSADRLFLSDETEQMGAVCDTAVLKTESAMMQNSATGGSAEYAEEMKATAESAEEKQFLLQDIINSEETRHKINEEIIRQMQERIASGEGTYYLACNGQEDGFESIKDSQEFYINEEGHLVIVFDEGEVAPASMGCVEFVIPDELIQSLK